MQRPTAINLKWALDEMTAAVRNQPREARVAFRPGRVNRLLGTTLSTHEQRELLARVGVATEEAVASATTIVIAAGTRPPRAITTP